MTRPQDHPLDTSAEVILLPESAPPSAAGTIPLLAKVGGLRLQSVLAVALKAGAAASALLLQWLIARIYGPEGTGLFALMATTVTFIGVISVAGQDYIALRNVAGDLAEGKPASARAHAKASVRIAAISTVLGTLAVVAVAIAYGTGLQASMMPVLLLAVPVVAGLSLGRVFAFVARAGGRVVSSQLPDGPITSTVSVTLLLAAALAWGQPPTWTLGAVYGVAYLAALIFAAALYRKVTSAWPRDGARKPLRPIILAGLPLTLGSASPYFSDWLIIFSATALFSPAVAGQIRIVTLFLSVMYLITIALDAILSPQIASAVRLRDRSRLRSLYIKYVLTAVTLNIPLLVVGTIFPTYFLSLFGSEYSSVAPAFPIAVIIQMISILCGPAGLVIVMAHKERLIVTINIVGMLALFVGCIWIMPTFGLTGGAIVSAVVLISKRLTEVILLRNRVWKDI